MYVCNIAIYPALDNIVMYMCVPNCLLHHVKWQYEVVNNHL